ncbi:lysophospholipase [Pontiellaceae bacterium B12227]|nr:lysophospholipase [Pontiellaceae bacterium B12227]
MRISEFKLISRDGLQLQGRLWVPALPPKAAVVLIHGLGEHAGRYSHTVSALNAAGYAVAACDLRGHGRSEGKRGHTPHYDLLLDDIFRTLEKTAELVPSLPLFLYGHSLGGNLAITYTLKHKPALAGVIATAPLLRLVHEPPMWQQALLRGFQTLKVQPSIPNGIDDRHLSRDINVVRAYRNDPLTHRKITAPLAVGMLEAGEWCLAHAHEFPTPLLLVHGDADQITSFKATEEFANLSSDQCTLKILPGVYHEPHNEPERREILLFITDWLNGCLTI